METTNRCISGNITITRKDKQIEVNHPLLECKETFLTKREAVEYVEKYLINALQESCFNLRDLMRKDPDKLQIIFKFYVKICLNK